MHSSRSAGPDDEILGQLRDRVAPHQGKFDLRPSCLARGEARVAPVRLPRRQAPGRGAPGRVFGPPALNVLGIETSCDETSVAVVDGDGRVLANIIATQMEAHALYGGVVPELAARAHL